MPDPAELRLYDTMTRSVEPFAPADGRTVRMYTCGPTVYNPAHLGNFRTFLFEDLLRRTLRLRGWAVDQVMNLTDVDDKIIAKAHREGVTIGAMTDPMITVFHADRRYLKIEDAEHYPRATAYIPQMIELVGRLMARELAYRVDDGSVYFAIGRFPQYGRLSRLDTREVKAGARVAQDDYSKENAQDFALWKAAKPEDERAGAAWDSPWGRGRPGWHLECSAMALALLGDTFDLHCGGVDLIFPHHEDEIAQSEGATGVTFSRRWCHGEFLLTDGAKMAKRVGNVMAVADLRAARISGAALRHLMYTTHYRQVLNLSEAALEASQRAVAHVGEFAERVSGPGGGPEVGRPRWRRLRMSSPRGCGRRCSTTSTRRRPWRRCSISCGPRMPTSTREEPIRRRWSGLGGRWLLSRPRSGSCRRRGLEGWLGVGGGGGVRMGPLRLA